MAERYLPKGPIINRPDSDVRVMLMKDPDPFRPADKKKFIRVQVFSSRKVMVGRLSRQHDIYPWECSSEREFEHKIMTAAAAHAAIMNAEYGEQHDPDECARKARDGYRKLRMDGEVYTAPPQERGLGVQE